MDAKDFHHHIHYLSSTGATLSAEEQANLQCSLSALQTSSHLARVTLWGKILGVNSDYYVAQGFDQDVFAPEAGGYEHAVLDKKTTYFSSDGINWAQLPEVDMTDGVMQRVVRLRMRFSGEPGYEYNVEVPKPDDEEEDAHAAAEEPAAAAAPSEDGSEHDEDDEEDRESEIAPDVPGETVIVTEEKRLAAVVAAIDHDAAVVPRGALVLDAKKRVVANTMWSGLSNTDAQALSSYFHLRSPETLLKKTLLERETLDKHLDFLDSLAEDVPANTWALRAIQEDNVMTGRSLLWPGMVFFHVPGTKKHGYAYFGYGDFNVDLGFAL